MADLPANQSSEESASMPTRSPSFPFIDLETAVQRTQQFYDAEKRNAAPPGVAVGHWNYSTKSSGGKQTLAALRAYGLLSGKERVALTSRALKIVVPGAPDRDKSIREAALAPTEFKRLWDEHGSEMPSDQSLRHELLIHRGYNENSVDTFINNYKATVAYARLADFDSKSPAEEEVEETTTPAEGVSMQAQVLNLKPALAPMRPAFATEVPPVTFPLPRGNVVEIRLKSRVTEKEFQQLKQLFDLLGPSLIERVVLYHDAGNPSDSPRAIGEFSSLDEAKAAAEREWRKRGCDPERDLLLIWSAERTGSALAEYRGTWE